MYGWAEEESEEDDDEDENSEEEAIRAVADYIAEEEAFEEEYPDGWDQKKARKNKLSREGMRAFSIGMMFHSLSFLASLVRSM